MNLKTHNQKQNCARLGRVAVGSEFRLQAVSTPRRLKAELQTEVVPLPPACGSTHENAVALVITLLMLSVITFLAIAFLAMTSRDRNAVTATLDLNTARSMSDSALARAQAEIIAQMMSTTDILSYDYRASHNYINPNGFVTGNQYYYNVNYGFISNGTPGSLPYSAQTDPGDWATNIGNLFYDPRPPVFVPTGYNGSQPVYDFRFWVDLNRNGLFESNGLVNNTDPITGQTTGIFSYYNGEPEWIGVLKYPGTNHSASNPFIGRYAFMVLPIGKTLDWNFIHNYSKIPGGPGLKSPTPLDEFSRDEGVGSWELNLAGMLANTNINTNIYPTVPNPNAYNYTFSPAFGNSGYCFNDAAQFIRFRYASFTNPSYPLNLNQALQSLGTAGPPAGTLNTIDEYGQFPSFAAPFDYNQYWSTASQQAPGLQWPGSYNTNMFYDIQELFDTNKTGPRFAPNLLSWMSNAKDTYDHYTFQRLLACIGMSSAPEYGVYVYPNGMTNGVLGTPPTLLRTKININYDNSQQIQSGPYSPMSTNLTNWVPLSFFTNAADMLLSAQEFPVTNAAGNVLYFNHFGLGNGGIPIYCSTNTSFAYNAKIHRLLQLAANIYESVSAPTNYIMAGLQPVYFPHVYRPLFYVSNSAGTITVNITGYTNVVPNDPALGYLFYNLSDTNALLPFVGKPSPKINIWGIPWVVGTVKYLPSFNKFTYDNRVIAQRMLIFTRAGSGGKAVTNTPPQYTNQFYVFTVSNMFGMDAWCPYTNGFQRQISIFASNYITLQLTNNYNHQYTNIFEFQTNAIFTLWPRWNLSVTSPSGFIPILQTNVVSVPTLYYSDVTGTFQPWAPAYAFSQSYSGGSLPPDFQQSTLPVHSWTLYITNRVIYYVYDTGTGRLLDFVNLGPFVSTNSLIPVPAANGPQSGPWVTAGATDTGGLSAGVTYQISSGSSITAPLFASLNPAAANGSGQPHYSDQVYMFGAGYNPSNMFDQVVTWVANDPLVHYTTDDLTWPGNTTAAPVLLASATALLGPLTNDVGHLKRYDPWPGTAFPGQQLFRDAGVTKPDDWQFPTNSLPSVGWLGRIHRGTPWQTVYLKSDFPAVPQTDWAGAQTSWVNTYSTYDTYPTNDWQLIDLFTTVPNDNAARGLLSVNQTNDAAWAAVFAGVIVQTNALSGTPINPTNDIYNLVDAVNGLNLTRATNINGLFHHVGDILQASALTVNSPFLANAGPLNDEMVERIPQQTLSLVKLGLPQFVIYSWGQSLKPKNLYQGGPANLNNICTNYEITGEFLTRTVCHVVGDPTASQPKIVVDSYNIEPGN